MAAQVVLPALVTAGCSNIAFTGPAGVDGYTKAYDKFFQVSASTNCTVELAKSDGGDNDTCEFHHYGMGLVMYPSIAFPKGLENSGLDNSTQSSIFSAVRAGGQDAAVAVNFNHTIVANYTVLEDGIPVNHSGFYAFTPTMRCWNATVSGCSDGDLEGQEVTPCGIAWLDSLQSSKAAGEQSYAGTENWVASDTGVKNDPQPPYDTVAGEATVSNSTGSSTGGNGDVGSKGSGAMDVKTNFWILSIGLFLAIYSGIC